LRPGYITRDRRPGSSSCNIATAPREIDAPARKSFPQACQKHNGRSGSGYTTGCPAAALRLAQRDPQWGWRCVARYKPGVRLGHKIGDVGNVGMSGQCPGLGNVSYVTGYERHRRLRRPAAMSLTLEHDIFARNQRERIYLRRSNSTGKAGFHPMGVWCRHDTTSSIYRRKSTKWAWRQPKPVALKYTSNGTR
jgi:hypothetical protein